MVREHQPGEEEASGRGCPRGAPAHGSTTDRCSPGALQRCHGNPAVLFPRGVLATGSHLREPGGVALRPNADPLVRLPTVEAQISDGLRRDSLLLLFLFSSIFSAFTLKLLCFLLPLARRDLCGCRLLQKLQSCLVRGRFRPLPAWRLLAFHSILGLKSF